MKGYESGVVLFSALLFLFVMSLLMATNLETHLLENRMSRNYYSSILVFEAAEQGLRAAELAAVQQKPILLPLSKIKISCQTQLLSVDACGKKRFRITAKAMFKHAMVKLMSEYECLLHAQTPACRKELINRRIYWKAIY